MQHKCQLTPWRDPENPEITEMKSLKLSHKQIENLEDQNGPEQFPRAFKLIISVHLP